MKKLILILLFFPIASVCISQNTNVDSLKTWNDENPDKDSLRLHNLYLISQKLAEVNPVEAWKYAYEVQKLSQKANLKIGLALSKINFGILEGLDGNYERSLENYLQAITISENIGWENGQAICLNKISESYQQLRQYSKCIENAEKAVKINEKSKNFNQVSINYEIIGQAYYLQDKYKLALFYFKKAHDVTIKEKDNFQIKGKLYTDFGKVFSSKKKYSIASDFFKKAIKLNVKLNSQIALVETYIEQGKSYRNQGEFKSALIAFKTGLSLADELKNNKSISDIYREMSLTNQMNGDLNLALTNFQKHSATDDLISARKIATRNELMLLKLDSYFRGKENTKLKKIKEYQDSEIKSKAAWISLLAAALVLLALSAGYWVYQNRLKQMKKVQIAQEATIHQMELAERIRKQIARDLHDDMGSTLSSISILSQVAEKQLITDNDVTKNLLGKITQNSQRMLDTMNDIVWTTQPVNDSLESITIKIREFAAEMLDAKDIKYQIDVCEEILSQKLPPNHLYNFYLIIKEAINNIAKYAEAKNVKVTIKRISDKLLLTITDDGIGFEDNNVKGTGNGLKNMHKRSQDLGGALQIKSWLGQGSEINFELPIE